MIRASLTALKLFALAILFHSIRMLLSASFLVRVISVFGWRRMARKTLRVVSMSPLVTRL
jgi:hypothetical protein